MLKKYIILIIPIVIFAEWQIQVVDTNGGAGASLALDSRGIPCISYGDSDNRLLKYTWWTGTDWQTRIVDSIGDWQAPISSLILDTFNVPHIAYFYQPTSDLRYAFWSDSLWFITVIDTLNNTGYIPSIDIDITGDPHISYLTIDSWDLKHASSQNGNWSIEIVDSGNVRILPSSLVMDGNSMIHTTYVELLSNQQGNLKYAKKMQTGWIIEIFDNSETPRPGAIALDSLSQPHIVYSVMHSLVKYAHWNGVDWIIEEVHGVPRQVNCVDIALDKNGLPHIAYSIDEMGIWYAYKTPGGVWEREQVINGIFGQVSLALDSADTPHIAFHDNRTFYAKRNQTGIEHKWSFPQTNFITVYPNPVNQILGIRFCGMQDEVKTLKIFDVSGRVVRDLSALLSYSGDALDWDLCDKHGHKVESGVYFLLARFGSMNINKKIIVVR